MAIYSGVAKQAREQPRGGEEEEDTRRGSHRIPPRAYLSLLVSLTQQINVPSALRLRNYRNTSTDTAVLQPTSLRIGSEVVGLAYTSPSFLSSNQCFSFFFSQNKQRSLIITFRSVQDANKLVKKIFFLVFLLLLLLL